MCPMFFQPAVASENFAILELWVKSQYREYKFNQRITTEGITDGIQEKKKNTSCGVDPALIMRTSLYTLSIRMKSHKHHCPDLHM